MGPALLSTVAVCDGTESGAHDTSTRSSRVPYQRWPGSISSPAQGDRLMKRSTERILTTHVGSLPRPDDLVQLMYAKQEGQPIDRATFDERVRGAVAEAVAKQQQAGIDVV